MWMSKKRSSRTEDMVFWLLDIFDITMLLLYGEGSRALIRLQEEGLKSLAGLILKALEGVNECTENEYRSALTNHTANFSCYRGLQHSGLWRRNQSVETTNMNLRINVFLCVF
ncbi:hypothetical protein CC78DRAFT_593544 [Lojkania enalia]|uniref:Uncharacterized protein n=1 Tax=Lojkania enalia TaxID=147567 RepID=A0A9P4N1M2_9PLEO|nr:hypothetical protein CC78DRAFT_593544 [Didymosphaeria enalia]